MPCEHRDDRIGYAAQRALQTTLDPNVGIMLKAKIVAAMRNPSTYLIDTLNGPVMVCAE